MIKFIFKLFAPLLVIMLFSGCGPTRIEVVEQYMDQFIEQQIELETIKNLALTVNEDIENKNISPAPFYNNKDKTGNINFLFVEEIENPSYFKPYPSREEEIPSITFLNDKLRKARQKVLIADYYDENSGSFKSDGTLESEFDEALNYQFVCIIETVKYIKPEIIDTSTFRQGELTLRASIFDLSNNKILSSVAFTVYSDSTVNISSANDENFTLERDIWHNAGKDLFNKLEETTNLEYTPYS